MLTEGMFLVDRYEILSKVGAGGMSDVYKAKDHILGRVVAIKVLKSEFSQDANFVTKFRTEAQSAAGLEHPNIVNVYDVGEEMGIHYIVMELVEGITLKNYIERKNARNFFECYDEMFCLMENWKQFKLVCLNHVEHEKDVLNNFEL